MAAPLELSWRCIAPEASSGSTTLAGFGSPARAAAENCGVRPLGPVLNPDATAGCAGDLGCACAAAKICAALAVELLVTAETRASVAGFPEPRLWQPATAASAMATNASPPLFAGERLERSSRSRSVVNRALPRIQTRCCATNAPSTTNVGSKLVEARPRELDVLAISTSIEFFDVVAGAHRANPDSPQGSADFRRPLKSTSVRGARQPLDPAVESFGFATGTYYGSSRSFGQSATLSARTSM
jgi:hypothetical protein